VEKVPFDKRQKTLLCAATILIMRQLFKMLQHSSEKIYFVQDFLSRAGSMPRSAIES
jgi:hypothetical protein